MSYYPGMSDEDRYLFNHTNYLDVIKEMERDPSNGRYSNTYVYAMARKKVLEDVPYPKVWPWRQKLQAKRELEAKIKLARWIRNLREAWFDPETGGYVKRTAQLARWQD